jgi:hypothetical protein
MPEQTCGSSVDGSEGIGYENDILTPSEPPQEVRINIKVKTKSKDVSLKKSAFTVYLLRRVLSLTAPAAKLVFSR